MLVEVCANSLQSALNAQEAGADRIELCSELGVGGITPSYGLIKKVKEALTIPVHVLVRPRSGHFTYSKTEFEVMLTDIDACKALGVDGIVSGILDKDLNLDVKRTQKLVESSKGLHFTFHRAFDWVGEPKMALAALEEIGVTTILTSGKHPQAHEGLKNIMTWQNGNGMTLMAGGGINPENAIIFKEAGVKAIHLSGTFFENEVDIDGEIPMNSGKHLKENMVAVTNETIIRQTIQNVK